MKNNLELEVSILTEGCPYVTPCGFCSKYVKIRIRNTAKIKCLNMMDALGVVMKTIPLFVILATNVNTHIWTNILIKRKYG